MSADIYMLFVGVVTALIALATLLSTTTSLLKRKLPLEIGFCVNGKYKRSIQIATGDPSKPIEIGIKNKHKHTINLVTVNIKFLRPIVLSGSERALQIIEGSTTKMRLPNGGPYILTYHNLTFPGKEYINFRIELNTVNLRIGSHCIEVSSFALDTNYKRLDTKLEVEVI